MADAVEISSALSTKKSMLKDQTSGKIAWKWFVQKRFLENPRRKLLWSLKIHDECDKKKLKFKKINY